MPLLVFAAAIGLVYLAQVLFFRSYWSKGLDVELQFSKPAIRAGEQVVLKETVRNRKSIPLHCLRVTLAVERLLEAVRSENTSFSDYSYRSEVFSLESYEEVERLMEFYCVKRGYIRVGEVKVSSQDLFYTQTFSHFIPTQTELFIYPSAVDSRSLLVLSRHIIGEMLMRQAEFEDPFSFRGIRPYTIGDPLKIINWNASARAMDLQVNLFEPAAEREVVIITDLAWDQLIFPEDLIEEGISLSASLFETLAGEGIATALVSNALDQEGRRSANVLPGAGEHHVVAAFRTLAKVKVDDQNQPMPTTELLQALIEERQGDKQKNTVYVLITSQNNASLIEAWNRFSAELDQGLYVFLKRKTESHEWASQVATDTWIWELGHAD